jgi:hypothetical protein
MFNTLFCHAGGSKDQCEIDDPTVIVIGRRCFDESIAETLGG